MSQPTPDPAYTLPTIHMNGTGARALFNEYREAWQSINYAIGVLQGATCNGRDFYPQGPGAFQRAQQEREEALRKLSEVRAYARAWMGAASDHL